MYYLYVYIIHIISICMSLSFGVRWRARSLASPIGIAACLRHDQASSTIPRANTAACTLPWIYRRDVSLISLSLARPKPCQWYWPGPSRTRSTLGFSFLRRMWCSTFSCGPTRRFGPRADCATSLTPGLRSYSKALRIPL